MLKFRASHNLFSTLAIIEPQEKAISSSSLRILNAAITHLPHPLHAFIASPHAPSLTPLLSCIKGIDHLITTSDSVFEKGLPEFIAPLIIQCHQQHRYSHIVAAHSSFGKNVLPRVAALLDVAPLSDVVKIVSKDTFLRPIYAGNALATIRSTDVVKVLTMRAAAFELPLQNNVTVSITTPTSEEIALRVKIDEAMVHHIRNEGMQKDRPELQNARIVIAGGRGLKSAENFRLLQELADTVGAALGASRAAVDAGFVPNDLQVGQTGKVVAPELYIAIGISGAIQHLAGMKDSKVIVAINKDGDAPIFQIADYGLVDDLFRVIPEMTRLLK
jgi:electron transfer flavoprotein alpha subunit